MKTHNAPRQCQNGQSSVNFKLFLLSFKENESNILYVPKLDVSGYGNTKEEAFQSFNIVVGEFLDYILNKKILHAELIRLGWQLKKGTPKRIAKVFAPDTMTLMQGNCTVKDVLLNKDYEKISKDYLIPV